MDEMFDFCMQHSTSQVMASLQVTTMEISSCLTFARIDTREMIAWMKGHESAIHSISLHASGRYALTTSVDTAHLWDMDTFQRKRKLNNKEDVGLLQVFFLPMSNLIMTCFRDDSIFAWECETLTCKYQLPVPSGSSPQYRSFAATRDGRMLAAGGRSRFIHLWSLDTRRLLRVIEMPTKVTAVKQLEFLPDSFQDGFDQILGVLSQDGIMRFINIDSCRLLFDVGTIDCRLNNVAVSPNGRYLVGVMDDGNLHILSLQALWADINKPPAPLVKVVRSNKMSDTMSTDSTVRSVGEATADDSNKLETKPLHSQSTEMGTYKKAGGVCSLNTDKLLAILKGYGEYPSKYRMFIWRKLLCLPENHAAYGALVDKGVHPAYSNLHKAYPIKSSKLLRILQRILSALAHWAPIFGETQFLPSLAFPFVKLFQNNHLVCFEMVATILVNWCQHWFEYFPNPPINLLAMVENILAYHDRHLLQHFVTYSVTAQVYAWPLLETVFSEVLTREEWLVLWDNIVSNPPAFLIMLTAAYSICARGPLMQCTELDDFHYFFHHRNAVDVKMVVKEAYRLMEATPRDLHPVTKLEPFTPLTHGQYPIFNKYPKFIVDYQIQERERIRQEEMEYLRKKQLSLDAQRMTLRRQQEEEQWYQQQALLLEAEEKRRQMILQEEQKLADQRQRLLAMHREVKLKELQLLDAARRKFLHFQKQQRAAELRRLDDELQRKALLRDQETQNAIEEAEIRNLELQLQKKMFEQELQREFAISSVGLRTEEEMERKQEELEQRIQRRLQEAERERELEVRKMMQQGLAEATQRQVDMMAGQEMEHRFRMDQLQREARQVQLARRNTENRALEQEVHSLMKKCQGQKEHQTQVGMENLDKERASRGVDTARRLATMESELLDGRSHTMGLTSKVLEGQRKSSSKTLADTSEADVDPAADQSSRVKFDRDRQVLDTQEMELLKEVRRLRQKLATDNRSKRPPPVSAAGDC
ncbi:hypothetical protein C0Q70_18524 [Pomacea canaliculata]|uniref:TBC1 domain family member 31 n=1 Tax=Pomacea canaliculata TaxID=400727 RepID=A0A2T7NGS4_POMCA|nr:hypothetical protein C0Q70_18524 [Pomacea canaliculata]